MKVLNHLEEYFIALVIGGDFDHIHSGRASLLVSIDIPTIQDTLIKINKLERRLPDLFIIYCGWRNSRQPTVRSGDSRRCRCHG